MDSHKLSFHLKHSHNLRWWDLENDILIPVKDKGYYYQGQQEEMQIYKHIVR